MLEQLFGLFRGYVTDPQQMRAMNPQEVAAWQMYDWLPAATRNQTSLYQWMEAAQRQWDKSLPTRYADFCRRLEAAIAKRI